MQEDQGKIWDGIYKRSETSLWAPVPQVYSFVRGVEKVFPETPLRMWDLCCGRGRHALAMAGRGAEVFGSDASVEAVEKVGARFRENGVSGHFAVCPMDEDPWRQERFHGVFAWNAVHHERLAVIQATFDLIKTKLLPGGLLMVNLLSQKSGRYGVGDEIEQDTFVARNGVEKGVPHHFFDEDGVRSILEEFTLISLVERHMDYRERGEDFDSLNPFSESKWMLLASVPA